MRIVAILLVALMSLYMVSGLASAKDTAAKQGQAGLIIMTGKISSIDAANNAIVIKEAKSGADKTINVDPKVISSLKVGEKVKVSLKAGSNLAESIKIIK